MAYYRVALLTVVLALVPTTLAAQRLGVSVSAFGGALVPTSDLIDEGSGDDVRNFGLQTGWTAGGRGTLWVGPRLAVEAEGSYASSNMDVLDRQGGIVIADTTLSANVFYASVNLQYLIIDPPLTPLSVHVSGGVGVVGRGGDAFDFFDSATDIAGAVGLGLRYGVAPNATIRLDLRDYISSFSDEAVESTSKLQNDLLLSGGIEFQVGG